MAGCAPGPGTEAAPNEPSALKRRGSTCTSLTRAALRCPGYSGGPGLWIFIAQACKSGKSWARTTGTVLFGIATVDGLGGLAVPFAAPVKIFAFVVWLAGLGAVVLLWRGTSSAFFKGAQP